MDAALRSPDKERRFSTAELIGSALWRAPLLELPEINVAHCRCFHHPLHNDDAE
jgi:hypothetical protein